jgi:hypothetical protein
VGNVQKKYVAFLLVVALAVGMVNACFLLGFFRFFIVCITVLADLERFACFVLQVATVDFREAFDLLVNLGLFLVLASVVGSAASPRVDLARFAVDFFNGGRTDTVVASSVWPRDIERRPGCCVQVARNDSVVVHCKVIKTRIRLCMDLFCSLLIVMRMTSSIR